MENAFSYSLGPDSAMQGGDSRYNRLAQAQLFKEANPDIELEVKTKRVTDKVSETLNVIANEPSLAFFRIQEHVRKCLPQLVETKHEVQDLQQKIQGSAFDTEYQTNAVKEMQKSSSNFENIQDLLKNAIFMKQQIDYEKSRRQQEKLHPSMYSTKSSPSINAPGDRPGRLSRTHSTSSDRSSRRSREKQVLTGTSSRPHSSCGVVIADHGREGSGGARSRVGVRDLILPVRKHHEERREAYLQASACANEIKVSGVTKTHGEQEVSHVKQGSVGDITKRHETDKIMNKHKKVLDLPDADKKREKSHKGKQLAVTKAKSIDSTAAKGHDPCKHKHERKHSVGKAEGLSKTSSSSKEDKFCHSHKETIVKESGRRRKEDHTEHSSNKITDRSKVDHQSQTEHFFRRDSSYKTTDRSKGDHQIQTEHFFRRHSSNKMTDKSKGENPSKSATSGVTKSSTARKDRKREEQQQRVDEAKTRHWSIASDKAPKSGGGGHRMVEGKHPDQE